MKFAIKAVGLFIMGLAVAMIIYPVMHELGHSVIAMLVGARVVEIDILPLPSVLCEVMNIDNTGIVAIGLSGILIPFFISAVINPKWFWIWYVNFIVKGISFIAFIVSAISSACFMLGKPLPNDDITQTLSVWPSGEWICLILSIILTVITLKMLIQDQALTKCTRYFEIDTNMKASAV